MNDRRHESGQALVEFALVLPLVLVLIVGIVDVARLAFQENTLALAAREGTRYAIVHGGASLSPVGPGSPSFTAPDQDSVVAATVRRYATGVPNLTVRATWLDGNASRGSRVTVQVTAPFTPSIAQTFLGGLWSITLRGSSTLSIEQ
jgi:Flp pilus assembly protein TadG